MIKYRIKNRTVEIEYETGLELKYISQILSMFDIFNEVKNNEQKTVRRNNQR